MLLENIEYINDLPFSLSISNVAEEDFHYHNEMEMLLVLQGETKCKIHNVLYTLKKGDVLIIDSRDMHRIFDSSPDILMLDMYIDLGFYTDLYPNIDYMIFACEDYSKASSLKYQDLQKKVSVLKNHMAKTAIAYLKNSDDIPVLMDCINELIFNLVNQFQGFFIEDNKFKADRGNSDDIDLNRLYKIIKYIYLNYDKKITLEDLSEIVFLSPYYISRLIKNTSGLSFQNFLNYVRLEYAEKLLVENELTLTQISDFCGFSSLSYFNKCFKIWYDMTPAQYRKQLDPCERRHHGPFSEEVAIALLEHYLMPHRSKKRSELLAKTSHHIFIPVKYTLRSGMPFKKMFSLKILISSDEDILLMNYQKEQLKKLQSIAFVVDYNLLSGKQTTQDMINALYALQSFGFPLEAESGDSITDNRIRELIRSMGIPLISKSIPGGSDNLTDQTTETDETDDVASGATADVSGDMACDVSGDVYNRDSCTVCSALSELIKNPFSKIPLSGKSKAVFTQDGLLTPYYFAYSILCGIDGVITELRDQYLIIKERQDLYMLILQEDKESKLKTHIHIKDIFNKCIMIEKRFSEKHNCFSSLEALGSPELLSDFIKTHINDVSSGSTILSCIEANESFDLDFEMEPDSVMFLQIRC